MSHREKVEIPRDRPCIFLDGKGRGITTITYDAHEQTDTSATFSSFPDYVIAQGITFKVYIDHLELPKTKLTVELWLEVVKGGTARKYGSGHSTKNPCRGRCFRVAWFPKKNRAGTWKYENTFYNKNEFY